MLPGRAAWRRRLGDEYDAVLRCTAREEVRGVRRRHRDAGPEPRIEGPLELLHLEYAPLEGRQIGDLIGPDGNGHDVTAIGVA